MVQDIKRNEIGVIIFGKDTGIREGTKVARTEKRAGIPVGEGYIGRVVDALGAPIDGKGEIQAEDYRPIENEAPVSLTVNRYQYPWRPVFWLSTPCSLSEGASVS